MGLWPWLFGPWVFGPGSSGLGSLMLSLGLIRPSDHDRLEINKTEDLRPKSQVSPKTKDPRPKTTPTYTPAQVTFTNCLPRFSPENRPRRARGAFSNPSTTCSAYFSLPSFSHCPS